MQNYSQVHSTDQYQSPYFYHASHTEEGRRQDDSPTPRPDYLTEYSGNDSNLLQIQRVTDSGKQKDQDRSQSPVSTRPNKYQVSSTKQARKSKSRPSSHSSVRTKQSKLANKSDTILQSMNKLFKQVNELQSIKQEKLGNSKGKGVFNKFIKSSQTPKEEKQLPITQEAIVVDIKHTPKQSQENSRTRNNNYFDHSQNMIHSSSDAQPMHVSPFRTQQILKSDLQCRDQEEDEQELVTHYQRDPHQLSQQERDVVERLFQTHKRYIEKIEKTKYVYFLKEMENMQEKPTINPNSIRIVANMNKDREPLYSPDRYQHDIEDFRLRKEAAIQKKNMEEYQKLMEEEEEIQKHFIHKGDKKLDLEEFYARYYYQIRNYENKKKLRENQRESVDATLDKKNKSASRSISPNLDKLARPKVYDERIESRSQRMLDDKHKKLEQKKKLLQPTFKPTINSSSSKHLFKGASIGGSRSPMALANRDLSDEVLKMNYTMKTPMHRLYQHKDQKSYSPLGRGRSREQVDHKVEVVRSSRSKDLSKSQEWARNYAKDILGKGIKHENNIQSIKPILERKIQLNVNQKEKQSNEQQAKEQETTLEQVKEEQKQITVEQNQLKTEQNQISSKEVKLEQLSNQLQPQQQSIQQQQSKVNQQKQMQKQKLNQEINRVQQSTNIKQNQNKSSSQVKTSPERQKSKCPEKEEQRKLTKKEQFQAIKKEISKGSTSKVVRNISKEQQNKQHKQQDQELIQSQNSQIQRVENAERVQKDIVEDKKQESKEESEQDHNQILQQYMQLKEQINQSLSQRTSQQDLPTQSPLSFLEEKPIGQAEERFRAPSIRDIGCDNQTSQILSQHNNQSEVFSEEKSKNEEGEEQTKSYEDLNISPIKDGRFQYQSDNGHNENESFHNETHKLSQQPINQSSQQELANENQCEQTNQNDSLLFNAISPEKLEDSPISKMKPGQNMFDQTLGSNENENVFYRNQDTNYFANQNHLNKANYQDSSLLHKIKQEQSLPQHNSSMQKSHNFGRYDDSNNNSKGQLPQLNEDSQVHQENTNSVFQKLMGSIEMMSNKLKNFDQTSQGSSFILQNETKKIKKLDVPVSKSLSVSKSDIKLQQTNSEDSILTDLQQLREIKLKNEKEKLHNSQSQDNINLNLSMQDQVFSNQSEHKINPVNPQPIQQKQLMKEQKPVQVNKNNLQLYSQAQKIQQPKYEMIKQPTKISKPKVNKQEEEKSLKTIKPKQTQQQQKQFASTQQLKQEHIRPKVIDTTPERKPKQKKKKTNEKRSQSTKKKQKKEKKDYQVSATNYVSDGKQLNLKIAKEHDNSNKSETSQFKQHGIMTPSTAVNENQVKQELSPNSRARLKSTSEIQLQLDQHDEMLKKFMQCNSCSNADMLKLQKEFLLELDETGVDSLTILRKVLEQFKDLFQMQQEMKLTRKD